MTFLRAVASALDPYPRVMPPPEPPLDVLAVAQVTTPFHLRIADGWPDPYGPDPVVFGSVPRVGAG